MIVRITMSYEPDWVVKPDGEAQPGDDALAVWSAINEGAVLEAFPHVGGGTSAESRRVVLNAAHVRSVHEMPEDARL